MKRLSKRAPILHQSRLEIRMICGLVGEWNAWQREIYRLSPAVAGSYVFWYVDLGLAPQKLWSRVSQSRFESWI